MSQESQTSLKIDNVFTAYVPPQSLFAESVKFLDLQPTLRVIREVMMRSNSDQYQLITFNSEEQKNLLPYPNNPTLIGNKAFTLPLLGRNDMSSDFNDGENSIPIQRNLTSGDTIGDSAKPKALTINYKADYFHIGTSLNIDDLMQIAKLQYTFTTNLGQELSSNGNYAEYVIKQLLNKMLRHNEFVCLNGIAGSETPLFTSLNLVNRTHQDALFSTKEAYDNIKDYTTENQYKRFRMFCDGQIDRTGNLPTAAKTPNYLNKEMVMNASSELRRRAITFDPSDKFSLFSPVSAVIDLLQDVYRDNVNAMYVKYIDTGEKPELKYAGYATETLRSNGVQRIELPNIFGPKFEIIAVPDEMWYALHKTRDSWLKAIDPTLAGLPVTQSFLCAPKAQAYMDSGDPVMRVDEGLTVQNNQAVVGQVPIIHSIMYGLFCATIMPDKCLAIEHRINPSFYESDYNTIVKNLFPSMTVNAPQR